MALEEPLLGNRRGKKEDGGFLSPGSVSSAVVLECSAAIGTGVLALPYGVSRVGVIPALFLFAMAAVAAYISNMILFACVRETRVGSYGELMTGILGKNGSMVLDFFVVVEGLGAVATYLVFIMDYVPQVCVLAGEDYWCNEPTKVALAASAIVWPLACMQGLSALRYVSTCSIITLVFTSIVVIAKAPVHFARHDRSLTEVVSVSTLDVGAFQVMSMACFAFMTHTNTPEIALQLVRPTEGRAAQVVGSSTFLLWAVYCSIAVCGFVSFLDETKQDFLTNYELKDVCVILCRCMLSTTLVFACPINICPSIRALFNIVEGLQAKAPGQQQPSGKLYENNSVRIAVTTACFSISLGVALRTPHVADLISVICAFFTSPLMFTFPALMYRGILKRKGLAVPVILHTFTAALWIAEFCRLFLQ
mmetsp:Transcript_30919/g.88981  ORF Transcript_30919/g.88981 Transcript_30919/m.88981 type:complete len:421 (+) Transcript_30919:43-1305(+)